MRTLETIERSYFGGCFGLTFTWKNLENNKLPCFPRKLTVWLSRHGVYKAPRRTKCFTLLSSYFSRHPTISTPLPVTRTSSFHPRHFPPAIFISTCSRYSGQITDVDRNPRFDITSFQPREQFRFGVKILGIIPWRNLADKFTNIFFFRFFRSLLSFVSKRTYFSSFAFFEGEDEESGQLAAEAFAVLLGRGGETRVGRRGRICILKSRCDPGMARTRVDTM